MFGRTTPPPPTPTNPPKKKEGKSQPCSPQRGIETDIYLSETTTKRKSEAVIETAIPTLHTLECFGCTLAVGCAESRRVYELSSPILPDPHIEDFVFIVEHIVSFLVALGGWELVCTGSEELLVEPWTNKRDGKIRCCGFRDVISLRGLLARGGKG